MKDALERPGDWPQKGEAGLYPRRRVLVREERDRCIGCGACLVQAPQGMFILDAQGKAVVTQPQQEWSPTDGWFIRHCPTYAISARAAPVAETQRQSGESDDLGFDLAQVADDAIPVVARLDRLATRLPEAPRQQLIGQQALERLRDPVEAVELHDHTGLAVLHVLGQVAGVAGDHRRAAGRR